MNWYPFLIYTAIMVVWVLLGMRMQKTHPKLFKVWYKFWGYMIATFCFYAAYLLGITHGFLPALTGVVILTIMRIGEKDQQKR